MKELYIRKGNTEELKNVIIVGEEASLGSRDSAYKLSKGQAKIPFLNKYDYYSKSENLLYVHAVPNISLDTTDFSSDHDVHNFIRKSCSDILTWDGNANKGKFQTREAFIPNKYSVEETCKILYDRLEKVIHNKSSNISNQLDYDTVYISFPEFLFGCKKHLVWTRSELCKKCNGKSKKCTCNNGIRYVSVYSDVTIHPFDRSPIQIRNGGNLNNFFENNDKCFQKKICEKHGNYTIDGNDVIKTIGKPLFIIGKYYQIRFFKKKIKIDKKEIFHGHKIRLKDCIAPGHDLYIEII